MSRWFRVYDDLVDDPKVQRLPPVLFKALINLWCLTSQNGGLLPSNEAIEFKLRMSSAKVQALLFDLREAGLLEEDETGRHPHNWNGRQFKSDVSNERVKRHRNGRRNVTQTVTETPPETETDTEQIQKESSLRSESSEWPSDFREQFWSKYPRKTGKAGAIRKLETVRKTGKVPFDAIMSAVARYAAENPELKFVKHPERWLTKGCWDDYAATAPPNKQPAYLTPPPGAPSLEECLRPYRNAKAAGTQVRDDAGVGANGADRATELPLSGGAALPAAGKQARGHPPDDFP